MTTSLVDAFMRNTIGFDSLLRDNLLRSDLAHTNYPPYNIEALSEIEYRLTFAVAGFTDEEINVQVHKGYLTVKGQKTTENRSANFLHRGLAFRSFEQSFKIGEGVNVVGAALENGILTIKLEREVLEEDKPKLIPISTTSTIVDTTKIVDTKNEKPEKIRQVV